MFIINRKATVALATAKPVPQYFFGRSIALYEADLRVALKCLESNSVDSVVCDPPYHLHKGGKRGFMGQRWDGGNVAFRSSTWQEVIRVLKPGGYLAAFGGTRTCHRLATAIEDAGFEIRDQLAWTYGTGMPKSLNISKAIDKSLGVEPKIIGIDHAKAKKQTAKKGTAVLNDFYGNDGAIYAPVTDEAKEWDGWGTAVKPAFEPICLAQKPLHKNTIVANVLRWRTGGLNIDACRTPANDKTPFPVGATSADGSIKTGLHSSPRGDDTHKDARWPANIIHDGSDEVIAAFPQTKPSKANVRVNKVKTQFGFGDGKDEGRLSYGFEDNGGSAARFFYCAKATKHDRTGSKHPTIKPVSLMAWLVKLVTPPGGLTLDCFAGSGSTAVAAHLNGYRTVLIEKEAQACLDIAKRMRRLAGVKPNSVRKAL